jgi:hypothetical protein
MLSSRDGNEIGEISSIPEQPSQIFNGISQIQIDVTKDEELVSRDPKLGDTQDLLERASKFIAENSYIQEEIQF